MRPSYLYNGKPNIGKMTSLCWDVPLDFGIWSYYQLKYQLKLPVSYNEPSTISEAKQNAAFPISQAAHLPSITGNPRKWCCTSSIIFTNHMENVHHGAACNITITNTTSGFHKSVLSQYFHWNSFQCFDGFTDVCFFAPSAPKLCSENEWMQEAFT